MTHIKTLLRFIVIFFLFSIFNSCSELIDCIASTKPELKSKILRLGYTGQTYSDFIEASVKNDSNDNHYDYYFTVDGNFPPGLTYSEQGRKLIFSGSGNQGGTYTFKVIVTIDYPEYYDEEQGFWEDDNRICFGNNTVSKNYTITIQ